MRITGGALKNRLLKVPKGMKTRPTSEKLRQTIFNILQHRLEGSICLDLFAGSGAIGIEALSRGAKRTVFIEQDRFAFKTLRDNLERLELTPLSTLLVGNVLLLLKQLKGTTFDFIYADPPYGQGLQEKVVGLIDNLALLDKGGILFIEDGIHHIWPSPPLKTLALKKQRKTGSSLLYQFEYQGGA